MKNTIKSRQSTFVEIASAIFILLFLYAALSTYYQISSAIVAFRSVPLFEKSPDRLAWSLVVMEFVVALMLYFRASRKIGFYMSLGLTLFFTIYVAYMIYLAPEIPYSVGAIITFLTWKQHLFLNVFLIITCIVGILLMRRSIKPQEPEQLPIVYT